MIDLKPWDGAPITEPGAYRVPIEAYHTQLCAGPSVSSSGLRTIYHKSPAHFWVTSGLNPDARPPEETKALNFGRAAHALLLGDEVFDEGYVVVPADAPKQPTAAQWGAAKPSPAAVEAMAWWTAWAEGAKGRTQITAEDVENIAGMAESLHRHPAISEYKLFQGTAEPTLIWRHGQVWIKSRPDMLPASGLEIADLKTTADIDRGFIERQIKTHGYDMQMALAIEGAKRVLGLDVSEAVLVFVEKSAPWSVRLVPIEDETLHYARRQNAVAMEAFARSVASGRWAGPTDDMRAYSMRPWDREEVERREAAVEDVG